MMARMEIQSPTNHEHVRPPQPNPAQKCTLLEVLQFSISRVRSGTVIFQVLKGIMGLNVVSRVMSSQ